MAKSCCIRYFLIKTGSAHGKSFASCIHDSDLAKGLETVVNYLALRRNDKLASLADEAIVLVEALRIPTVIWIHISH